MFVGVIVGVVVSMGVKLRVGVLDGQISTTLGNPNELKLMPIFDASIVGIL